MKVADLLWGLGAFVVAFVCSPVGPAGVVREAERPCEPTFVLAPCPVGDSSHEAIGHEAVVEAGEEAAIPEEVSTEARLSAEVERDEVLDCLGEDATGWLDCEQEPCVLVTAGPPVSGYIQCFQRRVVWRTVRDPRGRKVNVGTVIMGDSSISSYARRARMMSDMIEHAELGNLSPP